MLTFCDRTGEIFEISAEIWESEDGWVPGSASCTTIKENDGETPVVIRGGDGLSARKPFKSEW